MVRRFLLPADPPIIDYTRADADQVFHDIWINNALGAEKNWQYRTFREWSLVKRGLEEVEFTALEIRGTLVWAKEQAQILRIRLDVDQATHWKHFWGKLLHNALERSAHWTTMLESQADHALEFLRQK